MTMIDLPSVSVRDQPQPNSVPGSVPDNVPGRDARQRDLLPPQRLAAARATVVGVGAVGRQVGLQLAAMGVGWLQLVDFDTVETVNLGPQGYFESDDRVFEVSFNAISWFQQADAEEVLDLAGHGWGGDYPADAVAEFMEDRVHDIADMFRYLERIHDTPHACGFECHVDEDSAMEWLKIHRPDVAEFIDEFGKVRAGRDGDGVHPQATTRIVTEPAVAEPGRNPEQPQMIILPCFDITVRLTNPEPGQTRSSLAGEITSSLHNGESGSDDDSDYEAAIDGIESLVLAHACAGVDIHAPAYVSGVETAVQAASSRL